MNDKPIQCPNCQKYNHAPKTFGFIRKGNVIITPSTEIEFLDDMLRVEIKCGWCKEIFTISVVLGSQEESNYTLPYDGFTL